jgi:hypothetical protein
MDRHDKGDRMTREVTITIEGTGKHLVTFHNASGWRPYRTDDFRKAVEVALMALRSQEGR